MKIAANTAPHILKMAEKNASRMSEILLMPVIPFHAVTGSFTGAKFHLAR
jgi:hypothetical protein